MNTKQEPRIFKANSLRSRFFALCGFAMLVACLAAWGSVSGQQAYATEDTQAEAVSVGTDEGAETEKDETDAGDDGAVGAADAEDEAEGKSDAAKADAKAARTVTGVQLKDTIIQDGLLTAELQGTLEEGQTVEYTWYRSLTGADGSWQEAPLQRVTGAQDNIVNDGKSMNVAYDSIAADAQDNDRYWYYVEATVTSADGSAYELESQPVQNAYYMELQNGSFENPDTGHWNMQFPNGTDGLVWLTTGTGDKNNRPNDDIELVNPNYGQSNVSSNYNIDESDHGEQFAELNCEAYGALYQDVLTVPGTTLNWYLSHAGRMGTDEMALVIMPVDTADELTKELEEVSEDSTAIRRILNRYEDQGFIQYFEDGQGSWARYDGEYTVPEGQYVTRFFFVAVDTGATGPRANTTGNLLDRVGFGTDVPAPDADEGQLTITKVVSGVTPPENYSVEVAVDGEGSANDQTITLSNFTLRSDGTYSASRTITIRDMQAYGTESFDITETVKNAPTTQYAETSQVTVGDSTTSGKKAEGVQVNAGSTQQVTFTNTYEQYEQLEDPIASKKIRKNDDGTYTLALDILGDQVEGPGTVTVDPIDIVLVLDDSGSMAEGFGKISPTDMDHDEKYVWAEHGWTGTTYHTIEYRNGSWGYNEENFWGQLEWYTVNLNKADIYQTTKTEALKSAVSDFIDGAASANAAIQNQDDKIRIAVVTYGYDATKSMGLTVCDGNNVEALKGTLDDLECYGATNAGAGMTEANDVLNDSKRDAKKLVVFFTDGVPTTDNTFDSGVANSAVSQSKAIKDAGGTVYSIGIFEGADPSVHNTNNGSNETAKANTFMNAVSSNYPDASSWNSLGPRVNDQAAYYKVASDSSQLNSVFEDIIHSETSTNGYSNVAITDTLSEYAEFVNADALTHNNQSIQVGNVIYYELTSGIEENGIKVVDGQGTSIDSDQYTLYINDEKTSIRVQFKDMLEDGKLYTLMFDVKPTAKAEEEYANTGYPHMGEDGTDMEGNDTSSGHKGFHTNAKATYEWNGQSEEYKHPVLQVDALKLPAFLQVTKTLDGADLTANEFHFTVTAVDSEDEPNSAAAEFAWGDEAETVVPFNSGTPDAGENTSIARTPEALVFSAADVDNGASYSYIYEETEAATSTGVSFDKAAWKVTLTAGKTNDGDIKVDVYVYKDESGKEDGYSWTLCSLSQEGSLVEAADESAPTHTFVASDDKTMITIPFVNTFVGYGLEIYKGVAKEEGDTIIADPGSPLPSAQFTVYQVDDGTDMNVNSICTSANIYKGYQDETESNGYVTFGPFPVGTYYFKETRVPSGYQLMNQVIRMVVAESNGTYTATFTRYDIDEETGALSPDGKPETKVLETSHDGKAQIFKFDVANKPNPDLPQSGSSGTLIMSSVGVATIILAGVYLLNRRFPLSK